MIGPLDELLSMKQLAEHSGEHQVTWRKRLAREALPVVKISSAIRVRRSDYEAWLTARMETRTHIEDVPHDMNFSANAGRIEELEAEIEGLKAELNKLERRDSEN